MYIKFLSFRMKVILSLALFSLILTLVISLYDYNELQKTIIHEKKVQQQLVENHLVNAIHNIDSAYQVFEAEIESRMEKYLLELQNLYEQNPDFDSWNFEQLREQFEGMHIYVLNEQFTITHSSLKDDIGLDFSDAGEFTELLQERLNSGAFSADGMQTSVNSGEIRKFAYLPTKDRRFLLELGVDLQESEVFTKFDFLKTSNELIETYGTLKDVTVFSYDGIAFGKQDEEGKALTVAEENKALFDQAYKEQKVTEIERRVGGETITYRYIPYKLDQASEDLSRSRIIEVLYSDQELTQLIAKNKQSFIVKLIVALVSGIVVSYIIARFISSPILSMANLVERTARFELSTHAPKENFADAKDELGVMARAVYTMRTQLKQLAEDLVALSDNILNNTKNVETLSDDVSHQSEQTAKATNHIYDHIRHTEQLTKQMSASIQQIQSSIDAIYDQMSGVQTTLKEVSLGANEMKDDAATSQSETETMYSQVKQQVEQAIGETRQSMAQINTLSQSILDIADQTNLLALNASIEASRAGEHGRGFAVVAGEVRHLAEQSSATVENMQKFLDSIRQSTENLSAASNEILTFIDEKILSDYEKFMEHAATYHRDTSSFYEVITTFSTVLQELMQSNLQLVDHIATVTKSIEESTMETEKISRQSVVIADKNKAIVNSVKENIDAVGALRKLTDEFKF